MKKAVKEARKGQLGARSRKKHTPAPVEAEKKGPRLPKSRYKAVAKLLAEKFLNKGFTITLGNVVYMLTEALGIKDLIEGDVREVLRALGCVFYCLRSVHLLIHCALASPCRYTYGKKGVENNVKLSEHRKDRIRRFLMEYAAALKEEEAGGAVIV